MSQNAKRFRKHAQWPELDPRRDRQSPRVAESLFRKRPVKAKTPGQEDLIGAIDDSTITFGVGPAGSGKTYLASRLALEALEDGDVDKIILSRAAIGLGPTSGFLPGDKDDKIRVYLRPLLDELGAALPPGSLDRLIEDGKIEFAPFEFLRGRNLRRAFVILDEAQNCTRKDFEAFLTRLAEGSKFVILGDNTLRTDGTYKQSDLPVPLQGALDEMIRLVEPIDDIEVVQLEMVDCVRHPLVRKLLEAGL